MQGIEVGGKPAQAMPWHSLPAEEILRSVGSAEDSGLSGAEALPTILALAPRAAVIMISGNSDEELAKRTLAHGAFDYLVKPVSFDYLARSVGAALALSALDA